MSDPTPATVSPWAVTLDLVRRRWPGAIVRLTMLAPSGPECFCACAVQLVLTGTGAVDACAAFGASDVAALRALCEAARARGGRASS